MRLFLLCALALCAGCRSYSDGLVGSYTLVGLSNRITVPGQLPTMESATIPAGTKLIITHGAVDGLDLTIGGRVVANVWPDPVDGSLKTAARSDSDRIGDCNVSVLWDQGGTIALDGSIFSMKRKGSQSKSCSVTTSYSGASIEQTTQATKD